MRKGDFYNIIIKEPIVRNSISWPILENFFEEGMDQFLRVIWVFNFHGISGFLGLAIVKMLLHNVVKFILLYYFISLCKYNNNILNAIEAALYSLRRIYLNITLEFTNLVNLEIL